MTNNYFKSEAKKIVFVSLLFSQYLVANTFDEYLKKQNNSFSQLQQQFISYKKDIHTDFKDYKKAYNIEFKKYKKDILKLWDKAEVSTNHKWVQYNTKYSTKKVVDFKNQNINIEVIAKSENEAKNKISKIFNQLLKDDVKTAYKNDNLEKKISKRLKKKPKQILVNTPIIKDIIDNKTKLKYINKIKNKSLNKIKYKNNYIYKVSFKMPSNSLLKKAKLYIDTVNKNAQKHKIKSKLIYAIIHSESSFNPMARSHIPAFGLMQIVPKSAGIDSYYFLYGKKKVLPSSYLYNANNNIKIGSTYLHILYYRYLKDIQDPTSRLLCTISAYNTGSGNVAKAFVGNKNINKAIKRINTMTPKEVEKKLFRNLPYIETRKYLKKVYDRTFIYEKLLKKELS